MLFATLLQLNFLQLLQSIFENSKLSYLRFRIIQPYFGDNDSEWLRLDVIDLTYRSIWIGFERNEKSLPYQVFLV